MKHITFRLNNEKEFEKAKKLAKKSKYQSSLVQVFCGNLEKSTIKTILKRLSKEFQYATIIGATTAGEILQAKMYENEIVISLSLFEETQISLHYTPEITRKSAKEVRKNILTPETKALIVLSEGLQGEDYEGFIEGLHVERKDVVIAGGLAGDNFALKKSYIFVGDTIYKKGVVAVSLSSKKLHVTNRYNLNWEPIGKKFTITKAKRNLVYSIDNTPVVEFFKKYLGEEIFANDAALLLNFSLLYKEGNTIVARTPMAVDGERIVFAGPLKEGTQVQFGFSNSASIIDGSLHIAQIIKKDVPQAFYIYSCIARKTLIAKALEGELQSFEMLAPTAGFFTYGEFYSTKNKNALLNCTTTLLALREKKKKRKKEKIVPTMQENKLENITFTALTHFIEQTAKELDANVKLMHQYQNIVDASSIVSKTDKEGNIIYVNENFCRISQYTKEELLGKSHNIVRDKSVASKIYEQMWKTIQVGKTWQGVFPNRAKDGSVYYVDATVMPIFHQNGEIEEYIAVRRDVTKQIKAQKQAKKDEKLIGAIFDNQENIVILADKEKGMQKINKKFFEYFDYKDLEDFKKQHKCTCELFLVEKGYVNLEDMPDWLEKIAKNATQNYKVKMRDKKGTIRTFDIKIKEINNGYIINFNDITSLENALLKAHLSEQSKAMFLANMSHEIRTPLNGILGFTDILLKKTLDKESKRFVDIIHKSGDTLLNIVNDILDFSKLESGELELNEVDVNLFEELEATVSTFASLSKSKHVNYYTYIDTKMPKRVKCDSQRIKQVVNNLVSNAIKFTPQEGEVIVKIALQSIEHQKARLLFSVKDSGIGISKEKMQTIFKPFSQADNSISREFGGTGLGLSISNQFVNMMGSKIELKSKEGVGSEFFFEITVDIVEDNYAVENNTILSHASVAILKTKEGEECGINKIVREYLRSWNCDFQEYNTLSALDAEISILIVAAKIFDEQLCLALLQEYPYLEIIYIEGIHEITEFTHQQFHLVRQPMTGSSLFDAIVSLTDVTEHKQEQITQATNRQNLAGKLLIAEDNETNQLLISFLLDERNIAYTLVANGQEAIDEIAKNDVYDLVLMDINMPVLDGISATLALRKSGYAKPIVSLSANVIDSDTQKFKKAGMNDVLHKPIVPKKLDAILAKYLVNEKETKREVDDFDALDLHTLAKELGLPEVIVQKLLQTFHETLQGYIQELETKEVTKALAHNIRGTSGNMRLQKLHRLSGDIEENFERLNPGQKEQYQERLLHALKHIEKLAKEILA